jgi:phage-related protein
VKEWLEALHRTNRKAFARAVECIERLATLGHDLRRPHADFLRDGIYELRARHRNVHYRLLYFFYGSNVAVLAQGLAKEGKVPDADIDRAITRKAALEKNPEQHIYEQADGGEDTQDQ